MKLIAALIFAFVFSISTSSAADKDIIEELRRGEHFDRKSLFQAGPDVLADVLAGDVSRISLLAWYFEDGKRGFPVDTIVANRLFEAAYRRGDWKSATQLAKAAEAAGDVRTAFRYYLIVFVSAAQKCKKQPVYCLHIPNSTHFGYAGIEYLRKSGAISPEEEAVLEMEAYEEAVSRGFIEE